MKDVFVFTSPKEPPEVSAEFIRRGLEFLSQRCLSPDEDAVLRKHGLSLPELTTATGAETRKTIHPRAPRAKMPEEEKRLLIVLQKKNDEDLQLWLNKIVAIARQSRMKAHRSRRSVVNAERARIFLMSLKCGGENSTN